MARQQQLRQTVLDTQCCLLLSGQRPGASVGRPDPIWPGLQWRRTPTGHLQTSPAHPAACGQLQSVTVRATHDNSQPVCTASSLSTTPRGPVPTDRLLHTYHPNSGPGAYTPATQTVALRLNNLPVGLSVFRGKASISTQSTSQQHVARSEIPVPIVRLNECSPRAPGITTGARTAPTPTHAGAHDSFCWWPAAISGIVWN